MKIAIVAPTAIPSRRANTIQVMKMSQAFANLGHTVRLAAPRTGNPGDKEMEALASRLHSTDATAWEMLAHHYGLSAVQGCPEAQGMSGDAGAPASASFASDALIRIDWLPSHARLRRYDFGWRTVRWARNWQADLLYTRLPQAAAMASQMNLPTILEIHDLPQGGAGPRLFRYFLTGKGARRLVAITRALADDLQEKFGAPAVTAGPEAFTLIAPDGVDLARYEALPCPEEARRQLPLALPERFTVGYTGHFYAGCGVEMMLTLAARLSEINFLLVGGEPGEVSRISDVVKSLGLDNVFVCGFVPNAELPIYQAACEALLMPYQRQVAASSGGDISRYLSPMKVFEYLASGRAILSSDIPVLREVLTPENAILLPADDTAAWVQAIQDAQNDRIHRAELAEHAQRDALQYTWEARSQRILEGISLASGPIAQGAA
jgi:glycosyltransferase involved in cell wall biosynthesis